MENLNDILLFLEVARLKSFSAAARSLRLQKSTLSRRLIGLEQSLGVSLLRRTTRQVVLTSEGERYFASCRDPIETLLQSKNVFEKNFTEVAGKIKLTAPAVMGQILLPPLIAEFLRLYPHVQIQFTLEDRTVDIIGEKYDLAIRAGVLKDSSLHSRRLGQNRFMLFSSPDYFKKNKKIPIHPRDIIAEKAIVYHRPAGDFPWSLIKGETKFSFQPRVLVRVNHLETAKSLCKEGLGISLLPVFLCQQEIESGELKPLCFDWSGERSPVSLVYPQEKYPRKAVKMFIEFLAEKLKPLLKEN